MTHQRNRGCFNRHIAAATHGDPYIGLSQRRRIVDTVTDHGDLTPLALQTLDRLGLTVRQNTRNHLALSWGVHTYRAPEVAHTDEMVAQVEYHLLANGLVSEGEAASAGRGRPAVPLSIKPGATFGLGLHVGVGNLVAGLDAGHYTEAALALFAADSDWNAANIGLVGLQQTGLAYVA